MLRLDSSPIMSEPTVVLIPEKPEEEEMGDFDMRSAIEEPIPATLNVAAKRKNTARATSSFRKKRRLVRRNANSIDCEGRELNSGVDLMTLISRLRPADEK